MSHIRTTNWLLIALVVAIALLAASPASACPTCKDGIAENDPAAQSMAAGYFYSIVFMMSMPFLLLGTLGSFAYFSVRRARLSGDTESDGNRPLRTELEEQAGS